MPNPSSAARCESVGGIKSLKMPSVAHFEDRLHQALRKKTNIDKSEPKRIDPPAKPQATKKPLETKGFVDVAGRLGFEPR
jgi:hypothetical protein